MADDSPCNPLQDPRLAALASRMKGKLCSAEMVERVVEIRPPHQDSPPPRQRQRRGRKQGESDG